MSRAVLISGLVLLLIAVALAICFPAITGHTIVECEEEIPYITEETYTDLEPYTTQTCNSKEVQYTTKTRYYTLATLCANNALCMFDLTVCELTITNNDNVGGYWSAEVEFSPKGGEVKGSDVKSIYVSPHSEQIVEWQYEHPLWDTITTCSTEIIKAPTEEECKYVTGHREVTKTRTVTKWKTVKSFGACFS